MSENHNTERTFPVVAELLHLDGPSAPKRTGAGTPAATRKAAELLIGAEQALTGIDPTGGIDANISGRRWDIVRTRVSFVLRTLNTVEALVPDTLAETPARARVWDNARELRAAIKDPARAIAEVDAAYRATTGHDSNAPAGWDPASAAGSGDESDSPASETGSGGSGTPATGSAVQGDESDENTPVTAMEFTGDAYATVVTPATEFVVSVLDPETGEPVPVTGLSDIGFARLLAHEIANGDYRVDRGVFDECRANRPGPWANRYAIDALPSWDGPRSVLVVDELSSYAYELSATVAAIAEDRDEFGAYVHNDSSAESMREAREFVRVIVPFLLDACGSIPGLKGIDTGTVVDRDRATGVQASPEPEVLAKWLDLIGDELASMDARGRYALIPVAGWGEYVRSGAAGWPDGIDGVPVEFIDWDSVADSVAVGFDIHEFDGRRFYVAIEA